MRRITKFQHDGDEMRGRMSYYHGSPSPINYSIASVDDVRSLGANASKNVDSSSGRYVAKYTIGFEVERNEIDERKMRITNLFKGFEMDASCGCEAITNILPLLPRSTWRMKVYEMFHECADIIEDCPSNERCSTHMHIAVRDMSPIDLKVAIRKYSGILYAIYRHRLANQYCRSDIFMDGSGAGLPTLNPWKYRVCKVADNTIEFRIPTRVTSVAAMKNRYALMYEIVDAAATGMDFMQLMRNIKPIIAQMYDNDSVKVKYIMKLAVHMQQMLNTNTINKHVVEYVEGWNTVNEHRGYMREYYDSELRRMER